MHKPQLANAMAATRQYASGERESILGIAESMAETLMVPSDGSNVLFARIDGFGDRLLFRFKLAAICIYRKLLAHDRDVRYYWKQWVSEDSLLIVCDPVAVRRCHCWIPRRSDTKTLVVLMVPRLRVVRNRSLFVAYELLGRLAEEGTFRADRYDADTLISKMRVPDDWEMHARNLWVGVHEHVIEESMPALRFRWVNKGSGLFAVPEPPDRRYRFPYDDEAAVRVAVQDVLSRMRDVGPEAMLVDTSRTFAPAPRCIVRSTRRDLGMGDPDGISTIAAVGELSRCDPDSTFEFAGKI